VIEPVRTYLTSRALGISPWRFVRAFSGVGQAAAVMAAVLLAVRPALTAAGTPTAARLILLIALGAVAYVAGCLWRAPELTSEIKNALRRRTATAIAPMQAAEAGR
jgi:hypothetical protein